MGAGSVVHAYGSSRNTVFWGSSPPDQVIGKQLHSQKVTAWVGMKRGGLIGPFFFEDECGKAQTVNAERYLEKALKPFWDELVRKTGEDATEEWFQPDGYGRRITHLTEGALHRAARQPEDGGGVGTPLTISESGGFLPLGLPQR